MATFDIIADDEHPYDRIQYNNWQCMEKTTYFKQIMFREISGLIL